MLLFSLIVCGFCGIFLCRLRFVGNEELFWVLIFEVDGDKEFLLGKILCLFNLCVCRKYLL